MMYGSAVSALDQPTPLWAAVALGLAAASATWLGWVLAALRVHWSVRAQAWALMLAAAAMVAMSVVEVLPAAADSLGSWGLTTLAFAGGCVIALMLSRLAARVAGNRPPIARTAAIVAVAIGLHNIPEGAIPVGMALLSLGAALVTASLLAAHNVVEGLAVATPVIAAGGGRRRAFWFTTIATLGEFLGVLVAATFAVTLDSDHLGILLGVVAGLMITVSATQLAPAGWALLRAGGGVGSPEDVATPPGPRL